jgi:hypothetical protein
MISDNTVRGAIWILEALHRDIRAAMIFAP